MAPSTKESYPQAPPFTEEELNAFLEKTLIAKLGTFNADGTIHITSLWFKYIDGTVVVGTQAITRKVANIKNNPQVTVLIDSVKPALQGVMIYGTAEVEHGDIEAMRLAIFGKYMPDDQAPGFAASLAATWEPVTIRITPHKIVSYDYSKGMGK